jgi:hypothetical protein
MKIFKIISLAIVAILLVASCAQTDFEKFTQKYVAFEGGSTSMGESIAISLADGSSQLANNSLEVTLFRSTTDFTEPLTVNVTATYTFLDDTDFTTAGEDASADFSVNVDLSAVTIPAGAVSTSFVLTAINDLAAKGTKEVVFTITGTSSDFDLGQQESQIGRTLTVIVNDDDCPINLEADWEGTYEVTEFCAAPGSFNEGFCATGAAARAAVIALPITLTADPSDPLGQTAILSGGMHETEPISISFITCPQQVVINGTYALDFEQNSAPAAIGPTDEPAVYGTGTYNPDNGTINLVVSYGNTASGLVFDEFIISYSKVD